MRIVRIAALFVVVSAFVGMTVTGVNAVPRRQNIVLILTDDQRWDSLAFMPQMQSLLMDHGITFANAFDNNPLCCPTRTTIMTGLTSGHNGVWGNLSRPDGGYQAFMKHGDQNRQIFGWLHDAGYRTGLIGKFLNGYELPQDQWVMSGVDDWQAFMLHGVDRPTTDCHPEGYFATCYSNNGVLEKHGTADYSTTTSGEKATDFIRSVPANQQLFLYYAPRAPHGPTLAEPKYKTACRDIPPIRPPSYNRTITAGLAYMKALPKLGANRLNNLDHDWMHSCQTLLSVDDQVAAIVQALSDTGRLNNTLIEFASDNGFLFGEHRWYGKLVPYEESIRVPVIIRDDAVIPAALQGTTSVQQITSLDYTPTFLRAASLSRALDGQSLFPLLGAGGAWIPQDNILVEHGQYIPNRNGERRAPAYCGVRAPGYLYAVYQTGEEELYDLTSDPYELKNVVGDMRYEAVVEQLRAKTAELCDPPPPEFGQWP